MHCKAHIWFHALQARHTLHPAGTAMLWQTQTEAHAVMGAANAGTVNTGWNDPRAWLMDVPGEGSSPIMLLTMTVS